MLVIKVGGSRGIDYDPVCADLAALYREGERFVLVHGGSHETNLLSNKLGKPPRFVTTASGYESRYTDRETLEIFEMVYCGKLNKGLVEKLQALDVPAIGLSGLDGRLLEGPRKDSITIVENGRRKVLRGDHTGRVERVNTRLVHLLIDAGYVLVVSPPAISHDHVAINVDGDRAAARMADALGAERLVILSNVPGLLRDVDDEASLIARIDPDAIDEHLELARGRMKKKILAAREALDGGVGEVILADARVASPIRQALSGRGTVIARRVLSP
ncbi:MAG: [LysW]-aminoadipate kinase [Acidobacteria bacterium]|nr:[LysW]-aminoadipate kinase [Acidobacteriota bacterium]